jgi:hypothetical protein
MHRKIWGGKNRHNYDNFGDCLCAISLYGEKLTLRCCRKGAFILRKDLVL